MSQVACPSTGCPFVADEADLATQVQHMEDNHKDIIYKRLVGAGLWDWRYDRPAYASWFRKENHPMNGYKP